MVRLKRFSLFLNSWSIYQWTSQLLHTVIFDYYFNLINYPEEIFYKTQLNKNLINDPAMVAERAKALPQIQVEAH